MVSNFYSKVPSNAAICHYIALIWKVNREYGGEEQNKTWSTGYIGERGCDKIQCKFII